MEWMDLLVAPCWSLLQQLKSSSSLTIWVLVGSLFGFLFGIGALPVFMGDVGSTFLGAFAALVLQASTWSSAFALLLVLTPFR